MQIDVLCSGECNIRVDFRLIYPVLSALTLASLMRVTIELWRRHKHGCAWNEAGRCKKQAAPD